MLKHCIVNKGFTCPKHAIIVHKRAITRVKLEEKVKEGRAGGGGGGASVLQQENVYYSWCLILLLGAKFNLQW